MGEGEVEVPGFVDELRGSHLDSGDRGEVEEAAVFVGDPPGEAEVPALTGGERGLEGGRGPREIDRHVGKGGPEGGAVKDWRGACHRGSFTTWR